MARLILVHGFTQTAASWDAIEYRLSALGHDVVALDAPGHGAHHETHLGLWESADLLAAEGGRGTWVGYSMGGRLALHVALAHPDNVERLVLIGATPGLESASERIERQASDELLAEELERDGLDAFLSRWLHQPLFATLPEDSAGLDARRRNTVSGLAASLRLMGTGAQDPLWDRLHDIRCPVMLVTGALDTKFTAFAERMEALMPDAHIASLNGCGHAAHLEAPDAFVGVLDAFINEPATPR
ncbi:MAG: 2-succinyl-6-hydroxy-2,4-cyclohexadiene-carboxylate synthase [Actinomycetota bacterium]|jgi:2-succinyl-6-hydroxy-2,4-cyclohexadiene-1-carboxylate synthase